MLRALALALVVCLGGCAAAPAGPPRPRPPRPATARPPTPARAIPGAAPPRVSFSARDLPLPQVLDLIGRQVGRNLVCEPGIPDRVTLTLRDVPWTEALDLVLDWTHCEARPLGEVLYVTQPPRISMSFY